MTVPDMEADENTCFTGEIPSCELKVIWQGAFERRMGYERDTINKEIEHYRTGGYQPAGYIRK